MGLHVGLRCHESDGSKNVTFKKSAGLRVLRNFSAITPTRQLSLQMQANSPGLEFWTKISKFKKRKRDSSSLYREIRQFTSRSFSDGKEMYEKAWCTCKVAVLPAFFLTPNLTPNLGSFLPLKKSSFYSQSGVKINPKWGYFYSLRGLFLLFLELI